MINKKIIFNWKCPVCSKEIESLYKDQFEYNKEQHKQKHKKKEGKENGKQCNKKFNDNE